MANFIKNIGKVFAPVNSSSAQVVLSSGVTTRQGSILLAIFYGNATGLSVSSVSDTKGNSYVFDEAGASAGRAVEFWRCQDPVAMSASTDSITVTLAGGTADHGINVIADLWVRLGPPDVAGVLYTQPGSTQASTGIAYNNPPDQIVIAAVGYNAGMAAGSITVASPFTIASQQLVSGNLTVGISAATAYDDSVLTGTPVVTFTAPSSHTSILMYVTYPISTVQLTTPNLALAAPLLIPSSPPQSVTLTAPNLALAAPLLAPTVGAAVGLTTPNLALAAPLLTPIGGAAVALTTPNLQLAAPLLGLPPKATPPGIGISRNFGAYPSPAAPAGPVTGNGYEVRVRAAPDFKTLLCIVPSYETLTFASILNDKGSGTLTIPLNDSGYTAFWTQIMGNGYAANDNGYGLLAQEHLWQVYRDNVLVFEFLGETITEQQADTSEQRIATITGPGTAQCLTWAMAAPPGFPNIVFKTDAIQDGFAEINALGQLALDTDIWNLVTPAADVLLNPAGTLQIVATPATTFCGATPYDLTDSSISAQVTAMNGTTLDGSQLTQMYVQDINNSGNYALIGVSGNNFYCQLGDTVANKTVTKQLGTYDPVNDLYWRISESAVDPQNNPGGPRGFVFWTSADGATWSAVFIVTYKWKASFIDFFFAATYDQVNTASVLIQNLNADVVTPSSQGTTYFGEPIMAVWMANLEAAQARVTIPFITTGRLSAATDSFGNPWTDSNSVQIQNGTDLYSLLQGHTAMVNADYIMKPGFKLVVGMPAPVQTTTYETVVAQDRPIIWWPFNDAAGAGVEDESGDGFNGAATGVALGLPGGFDGLTCAGFNGQSSKVVSQYTPGALSALSAETWVNLQAEISYRTTPATIQFTTAAASQSVPKQAGTQPGDWIFIYLWGANSSSVACPGFTVKQDASHFSALLYRLADGSEGSSFTITGLNAADACAVAIATVAGAAGVVDVTGTPNATSGASSLGVSSVNLSQNGAWLMWFAGNENGFNGSGYSITPPAGLTTRATSGGQNASPSVILADNESASSGATGTKTGTAAASTNWAGVMVGLVPGYTVTTFPSLLGTDGSPHSNLKGFLLYLNGPQGYHPAFEVGSSSSAVVTAPGALAVGWNHLVGTFDGTTLRLYLNGSLAASTVAAGMVPASGVVQTSPGNFFGGLLEDAAVYNYALSPGQVQAHYNAKTAYTWSPLRLGSDLSQQIVLREAFGVLTKQRTRARDQIANLIGAVNSDGITVTSQDLVSASQWGQREGWVQSATQVTPASMAIVVDASLGQTKDEVDSRTLTILPRESGKTPFTDFNVGDWVGLERYYGDSTWQDEFTDTYLDTYGQQVLNGVETVRIVGITIGIAQDGMDTCELTINTYRQWLQQQMLYLVNKLGGQFINSLGTTPVTSIATSQFGVPFTTAPQLGSLGDVIQGTVHQDVLTWNSVTGKWQPSSHGYGPSLSAPLVLDQESFTLAQTVYMATLQAEIPQSATVVVITGSQGADVPTSVTDGVGNVYVLDEAMTTESMQVWVCEGATALAVTRQLSITYPTATTNVKNVIVLQVPGADPVNPVELATAAQGTSTSPAISGSPLYTGEVVLGIIQNDASGGPPVQNIVRGQPSPLLNAVDGGTLTWAVNPTAGQKIILALWTNTTETITSVIDNGTTPTAFTQVAPSSGLRNVSLWYADNISLPAVGSYIVTVTANGGSHVVGGGSAYSGVAAGPPVAGSGTADVNADSSLVETGTVEPNAAGALYVAAMVTSSGLNPETIGQASDGFVQVPNIVNTNGSASYAGAAADKIDLAGPNATDTEWQLGDNIAWASCIAVWQPAVTTLSGFTTLVNLQTGAGPYTWVGYVPTASVIAGQTVSLATTITSANWAAVLLGALGVKSTLGHTVTAPDGTTVTLDTSSGTAQVLHHDATGTQRMRLGAQPDGSVALAAVNSPPPLAPDTPLVQIGVFTLFGGWDGFMVDGSEPLADFLYCEVHVSTTSGFTPSSDTLVGHVFPGGLWSIGALSAVVTYYVRLVAINTAGMASPPSVQTAAQVNTAVQGGQFLAYNPTPGAGNLTESMAGLQTLDSFGNTVKAGIWVYNNTFGTGAGLVNASLQLAAALFTAPGEVQANLQGDGIAFPGPWMQLSAPKQSGSLDLAALTLLGGNSGGTTHGMILAALGSSTLPATNDLLEVQGAIALANESAPASVASYAKAFASSGHLDYVSSDGNAYDTGRLTLVAGSTTTINNTTPIAITGLQFNVVAGTYRVSGMIALQTAASGTTQPFAIRVNGTATVTTVNIQLNQYTEEGAPVNILGLITALNADADHLLSASSNNRRVIFYVDGVVTFSGSGTFGFTARAVTSAADETAAAQIGNFIDLMPVVA